MRRHALVCFLYLEHFEKLQLLDEPAITIFFLVKLNYYFIGCFQSFVSTMYFPCQSFMLRKERPKQPFCHILKIVNKKNVEQRPVVTL